jgi:cephalosporin-C deacetylase
MPSRLLHAFAVLVAATAALPAVELLVTPDHADGLYAARATVTWTVSAKDQAPADLKYTVKSGGTVEVAKGVLAFADGKATVQATLAQAGTLLLEIPHDGKTSFGGAAYDWTHIPVALPEPKDFDAFWKAKLAELAKVPVDARLEPVESEVAGVKLWKITMGNIHGTSIHGYVARPDGEAPCPALLQVQYAGVYPLEKHWSLDRAKEGWLVLNIIAHDLPVDQPKEFYAQQADGPLKNYASIGADDRETSYFLRMYLSCYRAADYLAKRPDWNHKTLLVEGGSQGGLQTVVTAGLHPAVTVITANVPAGCDMDGAALHREPGWPHWVWGGPAMQKLVTASAYYDVVNFAKRVKCPALIGMGLVDTTCPPAGVFAMINQLTAPKRLVIMPLAGHMGDHGPFYPVMGMWWNAAKNGQALPLQ